MGGRQVYNSTIGVKKRQLACGCFDYAFSKNRCAHHAKIEDTKKRFEQDDNEPVEDLSGLIEDLDTIVSRIVRIGAANVDGIVSCFTCDKEMHFSRSQCGHFISRSHLGLRWDFSNLRVQCEGCNIHKNGNLKEFSKRLELDSEGITDYLQEHSRAVCKPTRTELKELLISMRHLLKVKEQKLKK